MAQGSLQYGNWTPALFRPHPRSIGGIIAAVTIEEQHDDDLQITEHPVEQGAPITDHAFKRPSSVNIRAGWTVADSKDLSAETGIYGLLLSWQAALVPFDIITGKRAYSSMLIERLSVTTDKHSEFALMANIHCRQVIIVSTSTTQVEGMSDSQGDQASPETTAPEQDGTDKEPVNQGTADYGAKGEYGVGQGTTPTGAPGTGGDASGAGSAGEYGVGQQTPSTGTAAVADVQMKANDVAPPNAPQVATNVPSSDTTGVTIEDIQITPH